MLKSLFESALNRADKQCGFLLLLLLFSSLLILLFHVLFLLLSSPSSSTSSPAVSSPSPDTQYPSSPSPSLAMPPLPPFRPHLFFPTWLPIYIQGRKRLVAGCLGLPPTLLPCYWDTNELTSSTNCTVSLYFLYLSPSFLILSYRHSTLFSMVLYFLPSFYFTFFPSSIF